MIEDPVSRVIIYSIIPAVATISGSLLVFTKFTFDERFLDSALGFSAGLMTYVSFIELLTPSLEYGGLKLSLTGFIAGFVLIRILDTLTPHIHIIRREGGGGLILVALAIAIHNVPEGLAVGSSSILDYGDGLSTAIAIAIQDVPEGLIVAVAVASATGKRSLGFVTGVLSALSEYLSALASLIGLLDTTITLPILLSLSASAMMYVVVHEITPEIFGHEHDEYATLGFLSGLLIGLIL